jgi:hypothetical protein
METNKAALGALLLIIMVVGANFVMYAIARGAARSGSKSFLETLGQSFNPARKKDSDMDELRRQLEELEKGKKNDAGESES